MNAQEKAKNEFDMAHTEFKATAQKMSDGLKKWIVSKGGAVDDEGNIVGLSPTDERITDFKNSQLAALLHFEQTTEAYLKELRLSLAQATQSIALLKSGQSDDQYLHISDNQVLQNALFYINWKITKETTMHEFRRACRQTILWIDIATRRELFKDDQDKDKALKKRQGAAALMQDESKLRTYFNERYKTFFLNDSSANISSITTTH